MSLRADQIVKMTLPPNSEQQAEHRDAQCCKEVRSETGYQTYAEYLQAHNPDGKRHTGLAFDYLTTIQLGFDDEPNVEGGCTVQDISESGSIFNRLLIPLKNLGKDYTDLIAVLREPDSQTLLRVVLINPMYTYGPIPSNLIDAIGLCLRLPFSFFEVYDARQQFPKQAPCVSSVASFGAVGGAVFILVHNYLPGRSKYPPMMLILGDPIPKEADIHRNVLEMKTGTFSEPNLRAPFVDDDLVWPKSYELLLQSHLARHGSEPQSFNLVLLYTLLPLLEVSFELLKGTYDRANQEFLWSFRQLTAIWLPISDTDANITREVEKTRFQLRRQTRGYEQCMSDFKKYFRNNLEIEKVKHFLAIEEECNACVADAYGLEAEIRDWLQLQADSLALEEFKKSIQLSNLQIEEFKRGMDTISESYVFNY